MRRRSHGSEDVGAAGADARGRIMAAIAAKPGIHMRELERIVGISLSGISHHLRVLEKQGTVIGISDRHYRRYFLSSLVIPDEARLLNEDDRRLLAECQRRASLAIILSLATDGPMSHVEIEQRLRRSKATVEYHLSRLVDSRIVRIVPESSSQRYELVEPARVVPVLVTFAATLTDHTDGFARLWLALGE